ncbi:hypothetical protein Rsub_08170 [Raphidocelis subcapitata]|uniref:START domain-containing protein n=1 Tax=Raphidocelis subcapitata TaxID=307507 RepID=A0A2V0PCN0_9CHLO|nr:hypothetical protein Rsub_08170 [Raphidocelis subcapitata]|eukprot:GBF94927.1 hypothetical protein Rsub_08170 [Raphidocelis subcapitata]
MELHRAIWSSGVANELIPFWALFLAGLVVGQLLPRTRAAKRLGLAGPLLGRLALALHAASLARRIWHSVARPGTLRALLRASARWLCGRGWSFQWPLGAAPAGLPPGSPRGRGGCGDAAGAAADWYVDEKDLAFFEYHAVQNGPLKGASPWEVTLDKDIPGVVRYTAWRRTLPDGKTQYKSVTVAPDAAPREVMDLYLDDSFRAEWDGMVIHHEVLEHGAFAERQQVVRWVRRFPFAFLSDREYCIARRLFRGDDGSLTACTKAITHPRERRGGGVVRMDAFHSMWRSRAVPDPWGGPAPATETTLLHHEQFKIPERLARFAVSAGQWGFVKGLAAAVPRYVAARRARGVAPGEEDPAAYGAGCPPNPPRPAPAGGWEGGGGEGATPPPPSPPRRRALPRAASLAVVGGLALAVRAARGEAGGCGGPVPRAASAPALGDGYGGGGGGTAAAAAAAARRARARAARAEYEGGAFSW